MLYARVLTDGIKAAVVIGKHQSVRRHDNTRAETTEVDNGIFHGIVGLIQLILGQLEAILLHLIVDGIRQIIKRPHTLIGMGCCHG